MIVYLASFLIFFGCSIYETFNSNKRRDLLFLLLIIYLILHDSLRWETGTDWENYYNFFTNCLKPNSNELSFSTAYVLLNQGIHFIANSYSLFLLTHALIVYTLLATGISTTSRLPIFSLLLYYGMMVPYLGMNRQFIALGLCMFSLIFLFQNKNIQFLICVVCACLFHTSALIFVSAYFLKKPIAFKWVVGIFSIIVIFSLIGLINKLPLNLLYVFGSDDPNSSLNKIQFYAENKFINTNIVYSILAILKRSIWLIIALWLIQRNKITDHNVILSFNLFFVGSLFYILFNNTILQIIVARGLIYFNIFEIFLLAFIVSSIKNTYLKVGLMLLLTVYAFITMTKGFDIYREDLGHDIFRPYKFVFFK